MPNQNPQAGVPITAYDAEKYIKTYLPLKECLKEKVLKKITLEELTKENFSSTKRFFESDINAFIFSKETIMRFFEDQGNAEYLMVILGAKFQANEEGVPTVLVAGVNNNGPDKYISLNIPLPASEQPPRVAITSFPDSASGNKQIQFKLI